MKYGTLKENGLTKTNKIAHLTQEGFRNGRLTGEYNGIQIERRIYTDGKDEYIKINDIFFNLWFEVENGGNWRIDYVI